MRRAVVLLCLAACARKPGTQAPAPDAPPTALALTAPQLLRGEEMAWDVFWQGMQVGQVELVTGARDVRASFRTGTLASAIASVRYDMTTRIDRGHARATTEVTARGGTTERVDAELGATSFTLRGQVPRRTPDGQPLHTLTSALGIVRAWSQATAPQGYLWLVHGGELYRLDVFPPVRDEALGKKALRVDAVVRAIDRSVTLDVAIWLARNADRTPLRFVVEEGGDRVSAELVESTASFE
jgi:hypothetical protein